jgi:hypothetical protein
MGIGIPANRPERVRGRRGAGGPPEGRGPGSARGDDGDEGRRGRGAQGERGPRGPRGGNR